MTNNIIFIDSKGNLNLSNLHENQKKFITSNKMHTGIIGGFQSGKSTAGVVKIITHLLQYPSVPVAYYLPTYNLISDMLMPKISQTLQSIHIPFTLNKKENKITTNYGEIWMRSMQDPTLIISYSVGYAVVDEIDRVHINNRQEAIKNITARNSYLKLNKENKEMSNQVDYVCTPEGLQFMYDFFIKNKDDDKVLYKLSTLNNANNLSSSYIHSLKKQYTEDQLKAYLDGDFVNMLSGLVYKNFSTTLNISDKVAKENEAIIIGIDFNIGKTAAVIFIKRDNQYHAVDEIFDAHDTQEATDVLLQKYSGQKIVYPDQSGASRNTSGNTDTDILNSAGFVVKRFNQNPKIKDRVNMLNNAFYNQNKRKLFVNPKTAPNFFLALQSQIYKNGLPKKDGINDHILDAAGYAIFWEMDREKKIQEKITLEVV